MQTIIIDQQLDKRLNYSLLGILTYLQLIARLAEHRRSPGIQKTLYPYCRAQTRQLPEASNATVRDSHLSSSCGYFTHELRPTSALARVPSVIWKVGPDIAKC